MSRLYVGRLPRDVRERDIERLFRGYGEIRDICLMSGFGFVEFRDRRDAEDVMHDFNNRDFMGERLIIEPARVDRNRDRGGGFGRRDERGGSGGGGGRGRPYGASAPGAPQRTPFRVLVENLSSSVSWQDLKDFARRAGEVSFADAHKRRPGEGIVEFTDESGLRNAIRKLDGEDLRGRRIIIRESVPPSGGRGDGRPPPPRERSYGRRSRSRSPGASYQRRPSYRSRSPPRRRMSRSRSPYRSPYRSPPPGSRSVSPRRNGDDGLPPPPPPHHMHDSPISPRQPLSPRSPSAELAGHADMLPPQPTDDAAGANDGWE
ncbi:serine arginine-rich splicing factor [Coemansia sp. RSA 1813]|nr:serine arginine-rich splicing factor [Coemansia sp. RSA 1646]KAJ1766817.1 serine arginine-rich splicing factor [Coemansia sp. RSA 1843]KAJ2088016.1 serine arginine-rich splicing factor [Coemansia sp. RSA 986]KAJ2211965.1 serine arginine-rich splicing factor [Coemansia sp. RSA 487]KAJ2565854.1 serine arginine-rich splicing factor [Coemansia sp. RSA 1813]